MNAVLRWVTYGNVCRPELMQKWNVLRRVGGFSHCCWYSLTSSVVLRRSFVHSFRSPPYDRPTTPSKANSSHSAICCLLLQFPVSYIFLKDIHKLFRSPSSSHRHLYISFIFPPITCFRRQLLRKICPIQLASFFLLYAGYTSPPWL